MAKPNARAQEETFDALRDRHEDFRSALQRILAEGNIEEGPVERLEVFIHASGDLTYRYWAPRAEESEGGYLPPA
jgi:hypothetical protein